MHTGNLSDLVRKYYGAYESKDRKVVENLLSEDFAFSSPLDDRIDRATYFKRCWPNSETIRAVRIEKLVEHDGEAFVRYEIELKAGAKFRNTEYLRFDGAKIREIEVYFGSLPKSAEAPKAASQAACRGERKYACLVYQDDEKLAAQPRGELDAVIGECIDWVQELEKSGRHIFSAGLQSARTATTIHSRNGKWSPTDGPFAETKEQLGGFTLFSARDLSEAIRIASRLPAAGMGRIEVRPVLEPDGDLVDPIDQKIGAAIRRNGSRLDASAAARTLSLPQDA